MRTVVLTLAEVIGTVAFWVLLLGAIGYLAMLAAMGIIYIVAIMIYG
jgi:ABC-type siderophore export system fused ATPase/permease subunit